ncbi:epoxyalkane--coenzyme M transferase [Sphingomonas sp. MMS24-J13]|uniref:epoxyalkane--coenzyme M transferase n=1 Tax=Sphingomonas sp. MMS24-J13 TaxID=3238686 RepID=UPI0038513219
MKRSSDHILTSHVGALPGPHAVWQGEAEPETVRAAVGEVVARQRELGVDIVNEGELTKGGNWVTFINSRLSGFEPDAQGNSATLLTSSTDWQAFGDFYQAAMEGGTLFEQTRAAPEQRRGVRDWACTGPIEYVGLAALEREIALLREALGDHPVGDAFLTSTAPTSVEVGRRNLFYKSEEEFVFALAEALRIEYEAIAQAGFLVQVDDAWMAALWDRIGVGMGLAAYRRYCMLRVEALNHALRNVAVEQIRYHLCWGSWHGPHSRDIPLADIVEVMLAIKAGAYLFEAANARHEHEYRIWEEVKLPEGRLLAPGVVSHATTVIEHPELVAQRIERFARLVGRENVIASTDCGLGLRCHPQIAWAKLGALTEGARLASARLY